MRIVNVSIFFKTFYEFFFSYPAPTNLSYMWNFGVYSIVCLLIQILTGIFLAMHYVSDQTLASTSIEYIMRDVQLGWLLRYVHSNGASMSFITVYIHTFRGLYFNSYTYPRQFSWIIGVLILLLMILTAFLGYVLPWGQMSFWAATVITNLVSAIPNIGSDIVIWLWGGYSVDNATLHRFFSLHYLFPFLISVLVSVHLILLHEHGSNNPLGIEFKHNDHITMYPYYIYKDIFGVLCFLIFLSFLSFFMPNISGHTDNYIPANSMVTPSHIVPEWYFLPLHAILRSIPDKLFGVLAMILSITILAISPFLVAEPEVKSLNFRPISRVSFWLFMFICLLLGWIGSKPAIFPYVESGQIITGSYFSFFPFIYPLLLKFESWFWSDFHFSTYNNNIVRISGEKIKTKINIIFIILIIILSFLFLKGKGSYYREKNIKNQQKWLFNIYVGELKVFFSILGTCVITLALYYSQLDLMLIFFPEEVILNLNELYQESAPLTLTGNYINPAYEGYLAASDILISKKNTGVLSGLFAIIRYKKYFRRIFGIADLEPRRPRIFNIDSEFRTVWDNLLDEEESDLEGTIPTEYNKVFRIPSIMPISPLNLKNSVSHHEYLYGNPYRQFFFIESEDYNYTRGGKIFLVNDFISQIEDQVNVFGVPRVPYLHQLHDGEVDEETIILPHDNLLNFKNYYPALLDIRFLSRVFSFKRFDNDLVYNLYTKDFNVPSFHVYIYDLPMRYNAMRKKLAAKNSYYEKFFNVEVNIFLYIKKYFDLPYFYGSSWLNKNVLEFCKNILKTRTVADAYATDQHVRFKMYNSLDFERILDMHDAYDVFKIDNYRLGVSSYSKNFSFKLIDAPILHKVFRKYFNSYYRTYNNLFSVFYDFRDGVAFTNYKGLKKDYIEYNVLYNFYKNIAKIIYKNYISDSIIPFRFNRYNYINNNRFGFYKFRDHLDENSYWYPEGFDLHHSVFKKYKNNLFMGVKQYNIPTLAWNASIARLDVEQSKINPLAHKVYAAYPYTYYDYLGEELTALLHLSDFASLAEKREAIIDLYFDRKAAKALGYTPEQIYNFQVSALNKHYLNLIPHWFLDEEYYINHIRQKDYKPFFYRYHFNKAGRRYNKKKLLFYDTLSMRPYEGAHITYDEAVPGNRAMYQNNISLPGFRSNKFYWKRYSSKGDFKLSSFLNPGHEPMYDEFLLDKNIALTSDSFFHRLNIFNYLRYNDYLLHEPLNDSVNLYKPWWFSLNIFPNFRFFNSLFMRKLSTYFNSKNFYEKSVQIISNDTVFRPADVYHFVEKSFVPDYRYDDIYANRFYPYRVVPHFLKFPKTRATFFRSFTGRYNYRAKMYDFSYNSERYYFKKIKMFFGDNWFTFNVINKYVNLYVTYIKAFLSKRDKLRLLNLPKLSREIDDFYFVKKKQLQQRFYKQIYFKDFIVKRLDLYSSRRYSIFKQLSANLLKKRVHISRTNINQKDFDEMFRYNFFYILLERVIKICRLFLENFGFFFYKTILYSIYNKCVVAIKYFFQNLNILILFFFDFYEYSFDFFRKLGLLHDSVFNKRYYKSKYFIDRLCEKILFLRRREKNSLYWIFNWLSFFIFSCIQYFILLLSIVISFLFNYFLNFKFLFVSCYRILVTLFPFKFLIGKLNLEFFDFFFNFDLKNSKNSLKGTETLFSNLDSLFDFFKSRSVFYLYIYNFLSVILNNIYKIISYFFYVSDKFTREKLDINIYIADSFISIFSKVIYSCFTKIIFSSISLFKYLCNQIFFALFPNIYWFLYYLILENIFEPLNQIAIAGELYQGKKTFRRFFTYVNVIGARFSFMFFNHWRQFLMHDYQQKYTKRFFHLFERFKGRMYYYSRFLFYNYKFFIVKFLTFTFVTAVIYYGSLFLLRSISRIEVNIFTDFDDDYHWITWFLFYGIIAFLLITQLTSAYGWFGVHFFMDYTHVDQQTWDQLWDPDFVKKWIWS